MELPQQRHLGTEGARKQTNDFLSLYAHPTIQQDPKPTSQGGYLKTHDFLRPLEWVGKTSGTKKETDEISTLQKPPPAAPPSSEEHILPGGIGTYSISHVSYFNQRVPKPEAAGYTVAEASSTERNDENSNCSSYTGSGFTLWEESASKKGKTGKENVGERSNIIRETAVKAGWSTPERPSQASSNNHGNGFSSLTSQPSGQKNQSFMEMINSAKISNQDDDLDEDEEIVFKKESPSPVHNGDLRVTVGGKSSNQKANTPRSKHSATEQRRRSKINDRFQTLRKLIPHSDQKRDKASFLLEVIEYIQFLQEKVHKYEGSYGGWNNEPAKLVPWKINNGQAENYADQSQIMISESAPGLVFSSKVDEKSITVSPIPEGTQNPAESDMSSPTNFKAIDHPGIINRAVSFPTSLPSNFFCPTRSGIANFPPGRGFSENIGNQPQAQLCNIRSTVADGAADKQKEEDLTIEGGTVNVSSVYSRGLLNTLTQALQGSGVDLSQASISVQIELGKQAGGRSIATTSTLKENHASSGNQVTTRTRISTSEESHQALKKLKTSKG
ncbi:hypothetical protein K2173_027396 [Erythroxylum novogranatense]|uniref:BHLH domain-containing protein n=1 Tax=Erythroxylum novogranatense TaxID=1862640 RepID=A0AAV8U1R6_9ROSI|nr:hypothetical protein K2173_027396 [Erythroxylum novogranatense]